MGSNLVDIRCVVGHGDIFASPWLRQEAAMVPQQGIILIQYCFYFCLSSVTSICFPILMPH